MSQHEAVSRKEKKALRDAERHKKGKKRQRAEVDDEGEQGEQDEQGGESLLNSFKELEQGDSAAGPHTSRASRKRVLRNLEGENARGVAAATESARKLKKRKHASNDDAEDADTTSLNPSKSRFIVFVGNLPYKTTDDTLRKHFTKLEPFNLRHRTDPKTKMSKGFAFLEFENYDRMKTCLKLYHHSMFDPLNPIAVEATSRADDADVTGAKKSRSKSNARRINVELTAGGGGKTEGRQAKIRAKNVKLDEQRKRRAEAERKERARKEKKEARKDNRGAVSLHEDQQAMAGATEESHDIHPSRLTRVNG